jgi:hypothetical protein
VIMSKSSGKQAVTFIILAISITGMLTIHSL